MTLYKKYKHEFLASCLFLVAIACYVLGVILPSSDLYYEKQQDIFHYKEQIIRFNSVLNSREEIENKLSVVTSQKDNQLDFLSGDSSSIASAKLQKRLKDLVNENNSRVISSQSLEDNSEEEFTTITIRMHMETSISALKEILYEVDNSTPAIFIENIVVQRSQRRQNSKKPNTDARLDVRLEINGYFSKGS